MNSKNGFKIITLYLLVILFVNCENSKRVIETIDFKTEYKFSSVIENKTQKDTTQWKYQLSAADYATKGDYKNALIQWDIAMRGKEKYYSQKQIDSINLKYKKVSALDYIIEKSKENNVIIINEAHHNSLHRVFTKSLLKELYNNGYKNLGLEALSNKDSLNLELNIRKYPIQKTRHYTKDPQFGNLIRDALEIGYHLFSYENMDVGSGKPREIEQAKNIQKIINSKPNEKFLIHCGFAHVLEGNYKSWEKAMASRLTEFTGINPLTINQTVYSERSRIELNHPFLKAFNINEATVLIDVNNKPLKYERNEAYTDIVVLHPNTKYINNRPNWLFENGNKNVPISLEDIQIEFPVMVFAFKKGENINLAVPIDITEIEYSTENCNLGLKKGDYTIIVTNGKKSVKFERVVK